MKTEYSKILLTGGTGKLGKKILSSGNFGKSIVSPSRDLLDLTDFQKIKQYLGDHQPNAIIHCAALARMVQCEKDPAMAIDINIIGTANLVKAVLELQKKLRKTIRFIHLSTDGVYSSKRGGYREDSPTIPYNVYGWTKLGSESSVNILPNFVIVRTRFFDANEIHFSESPVDLYTSKIPVEELVKALQTLLHSDFIGTINVGRKRKISEYNLNKKYKKDLAKCTRDEIMSREGIRLAKDASLDTHVWRKVGDIK